ALGLATAMTAFWALPLVVRLEHTRALAWGDPPGVGGGFGASLALLALLGLARARGAGRSAFVVALFPWAMALVTLVARFTLGPRTADWPSLRSVERGLRLGDLWTALREAPPGRVLFVRSAVPLVYGAPGGTQWYRPHTHVTALAPVFAGRVIVHGTFTHPS